MLLANDATRKRRLSLGQFVVEVGGVIQSCCVTNPRSTTVTCENKTKSRRAWGEFPLVG